MKRNYFLAAIALLGSLFLYLFYRTEKTVATEIFISLVSPDKFSIWKENITNTLPLNDLIIYSIPEALWVFAITLTSKPFFVNIFRFKMNLVYAPLIFSVGLELLQLAHLTNGRFDLMDISLSCFSWLIAFCIPPFKQQQQNLFRSFGWRNAVCVLSYCIVYLAHVWK